MTPAIFIRQFWQQGGHFKGAEIAIRCAQRWNPKGRVIFIGDQQQRQELKRLAEFHEMEKYSRFKDELHRLWPFHEREHSWFLWAALSNFMVLADFVIQNDLPFVACFDTDVLLFDDIEKAVAPWRGIDVGACNAAGSMQCATLMSREALREFAAFVVGLYTPGVCEQYSEMVREESMCPMSAWRHFCAANPRFKFGNLCDVVNGATYCHNLGMQYGHYEFADGGRILHWRDGQPYGTRRIEGHTDHPRFVNLHCWSGHKQKMAEYVARSEASL
jgi:hypothetical protein